MPRLSRPGGICYNSLINRTKRGGDRTVSYTHLDVYKRQWLDFAGWNGGAGPLPGSEWHADVPQGRCFFARNVRFAAPMPGTDGPDRALVAEVSAGRRDSGFAVTCRVFADDGYQDLPGDWQAAAVQRCREEVMYLLNLSNDEERAGLYELLNGMFLRMVPKYG